MAPHSKRTFLVVSYPHLQLGLRIGEEYQKYVLLRKCKGDAAKVALLKASLKDETIFLEVGRTKSQRDPPPKDHKKVMVCKPQTKHEKQCTTHVAHAVAALKSSG